MIFISIKLSPEVFGERREIQSGSPFSLTFPFYSLTSITYA